MDRTIYERPKNCRAKESENQQRKKRQQQQPEINENR